MDTSTLQTIIGDDTLTDDELTLLLARAQKLAVNHYWWNDDDIPTDDEISIFSDRYEYEIYDIAKAIYSDASRDGQIQHTELGIVRVWGENGKQTIDNCLSSIPTKTYVF